jgi:hypothetical protein
MQKLMLVLHFAHEYVISCVCFSIVYLREVPFNIESRRNVKKGHVVLSPYRRSRSK